MDNQYTLDDEVVHFPSDHFVISNCALEEIENINPSSDPVPYENTILEDMDSYWDDLSTYLIVSRMVNDAVIKGIVNAVTQDAAADISSKEAEMEDLSERLRFYEFDVKKGSKFVSPIMHERIFMEKKYKKHLLCLKASTVEQLQNLKNELECLRSFTDMENTNMCSENVWSCCKDKVAENLERMEEGLHEFMESISSIHQENDEILCFFNNLLYEQTYMWDIQKDLSGIIVQNRINELQEAFNTKLQIDNDNYTNQKNSCLKRCVELRSLRNELDTLSKTLFNSDIGDLMSYHGHENAEWNTDDRREDFYRKALGNHLPYSSYKQDIAADQSEKSKKSMLKILESPHLSHMKKEEFFSYLKNEVMKMNMNHEVALQQKTEELFKAKRQLLKIKDSMSLKKDSELEILRKKIPEFLLKLDNVITSNTFSAEKYLAKSSDFKDQNDNLICENQYLRDLLAVKEKEIKSLLARSSEPANENSNHITQFRGMECMKLEADLREKVHTIVLSESIGELHCHSELYRMEVNFNHEIYSIILQGYCEDVRSAFNAIITQKNGELCFEVEKANKLKNSIESLSKLMEKRESSIQEAELKLVQQKDETQVIYAELCKFKEKVGAQEKLISKIKNDCDVLNIKLQEANKYVEFYKKERSKVDDILNDTSLELIKAENENKHFHEIVKKKEKRLEILISDKRQHEEMFIKPLVSTVLDMSRVYEIFGYNVIEIIREKSSRYLLFIYLQKYHFAVLL